MRFFFLSLPFSLAVPRRRVDASIGSTARPSASRPRRLSLSPYAIDALPRAAARRLSGEALASVETREVAAAPRAALSTNDVMWIFCLGKGYLPALQRTVLKKSMAVLLLRLVKR